MKILKKILIVVAIIVAIPLLIAAFSKKEYSVQKSIVINKPNQEVFDYVKYLKNQDNYSKWANMDANMKKEYKGVDATVGFISAWDSNKDDVGKGEQEIIAIAQGEKIDYTLRFIKPFEGQAASSMSTKPTGENQTLVTWSFNSSMPYPANLMLLFMDMESMIGKDLEIGLQNLKNILEK